MKLEWTIRQHEDLLRRPWSASAKIMGVIEHTAIADTHDELCQEMRSVEARFDDPQSPDSKFLMKELQRSRDTMLLQARIP